MTAALFTEFLDGVPPSLAWMVRMWTCEVSWSNAASNLIDPVAGFIANSDVLPATIEYVTTPLGPSSASVAVTVTKGNPTFIDSETVTW